MGFLIPKQPPGDHQMGEDGFLKGSGGGVGEPRGEGGLWVVLDGPRGEGGGVVTS